MLWVLVVGMCAMPCCRDDRCKELSPTFQVDIYMPDGINQSQVDTLKVSVDAAGRTKINTLPVAGKMRDQAFSVEVHVGELGKGGFIAALNVEALDAKARVLARGSRQFPASGDACNFFKMTLGVDAPADMGRDTAVDAGVDLPTVVDMNPDQYWPDAAAPDMGPTCANPRWVHMTANTGSSLHGVCGTSASNIYAVGQFGNIIHYNGSGWIPLDPGFNSTLRGVWCPSASEIWAVGDHGTILGYHSAPWKDWVSLTSHHIHGIWGSSSTILYVVGDKGTVRYLEGWKWTIPNPSVTTTKDLYAVWGISATDVVMVGQAGTILRYSNKKFWSTLDSGVTKDLRGVWASSDGGTMYAVGDCSTLISYAGDGKTWKPMTAPETCRDLKAVWARNPTDVYATGDNGTIWRYDGTAWAKSMTGSSSDTLYGVWGMGSSQTLVVGSSGQVLRTEGIKWNKELNPSGTLVDIWGSSPFDLHVVGHNANNAGLALHHDGFAWTTKGISKPLRGVLGSGPTDVFAVGSSIWRFDGTSWGSSLAPTNSTLTDIWGTGPSDVVAVGYDNSALQFNGTQWNSLATGYNGNHWGSVWAIGNYIYLASIHGVLVHSNGLKWTAHVLPGTSTNASKRIWGNSHSDVYTLAGSGVYHFNGQKWSLVTNIPVWTTACWGSGPSNIFAVTQMGQTLRYDGNQWNLLPRVTGGGLYAVWGLGPTTVYSAGNRKVILRLTCK